MAKNLAIGDLNAVLMAQLAHAGLLAARGVGGYVGDLVDSHFSTGLFFHFGGC